MMSNFLDFSLAKLIKVNGRATYQRGRK
jgi:hypothetical protein